MKPLGVSEAEDMMRAGKIEPAAPEVAHDAPATEVVQAAAAADGLLPVVRDGEPVGVIKPRDVLAPLGPLVRDV